MYKEQIKLTQLSNLHIHQAYNMWDVKHKILHNIPLLQMNDFIAEFFKRFIYLFIFFKCTYSYGDTLKLIQFFCLISSSE